MNSRNPIIIAVLLLILATACDKKPELALQFSEREQSIVCDDENNKLLNEALYTFEADLIQAYDPESKLLVSAYGRFMYVGFSGTAEYDRIVSEHALDIREALVADGIIEVEGGSGYVNYKHPALKCIINNLEDKGLSLTLQALIDTNTMNPKLFNSRMRNFGREAATNRYTAMYVALETYYKQLTMVNLPAKETNE